MTLPNTFANETSPGMIELDQNFSAVAGMATWNATATGTNVIALTTTSNQPAVSAYTDRQRFQFIGPNNSTGSVTVAVNSLAALPLYLPSGTQAASGDVASGAPYIVIYLAALNSGGGGFQIVSAVPASGTAPAGLAVSRGLKIINNASTPNTKIDITALQASLVTTGGVQKFIASPSVTIDLTTTGANGMDTGARPTSGWVYCYLISNGSVTAGLACATSPSADNPIFPGGYTYYGYVGAMYCDASQNLLRTRQLGRQAQYVVTTATNTAAYPVIASAAQGSVAVPTWVGNSISNIVPVTAGRIRGGAISNAGFNTTIILAPNNNCGPYSSGTNPPPFCLLVLSGFAGTQGFFDFELESTSVYVAISAGTSTQAIVFALGWEDYYTGA